MLFSSPIFLFLFLPIVLLGYYLSYKKIKNYWLLLSSLIFFAWGGVSYTIILIASIVLNYIFGIIIEKKRGSKSLYWWTFTGVACNLIILGIFKYANFITKNLNSLFTDLNLAEISVTNIVLPVGISFYTFHLLSYLIDIYRGKTNAQRNIFDLALYVSMFSQLIAGPIIRYSDVWLQLNERRHTLEKFSVGVERFIIGLGKKVLVANTFARIADMSFAVPPENLGSLNAWLGIVCYTLQIYCDFSGYSDMAIGLGKMFGFEFMENFNYPYKATSIKEFWRRWHISLSTFFRDYVYISLGGNRGSTIKTYLNLFIVFLLTGFWHGASWNFVVWGLFHGFFMILERIGLEKIILKVWKPLAHIYTLLVVIFAWVLFKANDLTWAVGYWEALFDFRTNSLQISHFLSCIDIQTITILIIALLGSFGVFKKIHEMLKNIFRSVNENILLSIIGQTMNVVFYIFIFVLSATYLIAGTYNPFIYYKF
jgi:alginate O-acetyltransferase complex protein AlgI